jgi:hypothetical protein
VKGALLTAAAVLATLLLASPASARWDVERVGGSSSGFDDVALAGNARGDAAVAFEKGGGIALAIAHRGRGFGRARRVPGSGGGSAPNVAIDEQGNVLVLWSYFDGFEEDDPESRDEPCCQGTLATVRYAHGRHYRHLQALTPPGQDVAPAAWAISGGRIGVAWTTDALRLRARFAARGRPLGKTVRLRGDSAALGVSLAHGTRRVTYLLYEKHAASIREFRVRGGRAVGKRTLARGLPRDPYISVATDVGGDQVAAWVRTNDAPVPVHLAARRAGGRFHSTIVSRAGAADSGPVLAIGSSVAAVAAWATPRGKLLVSSRRPGGRFGAARRFDRNGRKTSVEQVEVAVDSLGRAVIGWIQDRPSGERRFFGAFRSPFGVRSHVRAFGRADYIGTQRSAAIDASGRARLVWRAPSGVKVARAPYPGP